MFIDWKKIKELILSKKDLSTLGFANVLANGISAVFWLIMAGLLGPEEYGDVSYLLAIAGIATTVAIMGGGNTIIIYTAKGLKIFPPIGIIGLISGSVAAVIIYLLFNDIGTSLFVIGYVIFGLVSADILGNKEYQNYSKLLVTQRILFVLFSASLYFVIGKEGIIIGIAISTFPYFIRFFKALKKTKIEFSLIKEKFFFMINSYALDISRVLSGSIDKIIIYPMFGSELLGNYQLGIQLLSLIGMAPGIVYQYILPQDASGKSSNKLKKYTVILTAIFAALAIILTPFVIPFLFPEYTEAVLIIQIMIAAAIPSAINIMFISKFLGNEKSHLVLIGSLIFIVIQISGIFGLGKVYGVPGIAFATVLAYSGECVYILVINKYQNMRKME